MSWDKNTIDFSEINSTVRVLKDLDIPYTMTIIGVVRGYGLNDEGRPDYPMRRLEYKNIVMLEHIFRTRDCDVDDSIFSVKFKKEDEPKDWKIEIAEPGSLKDYEQKEG